MTPYRRHSAKTRAKLRKLSDIARTLHILIAKGEALRQARAETEVEILEATIQGDRIMGRVKSNHVWGVHITFGPKRGFLCMCPDAHHRGQSVGPCKHILALATHWLDTEVRPEMRRLYAEDAPPSDEPPTQLPLLTRDMILFGKVHGENPTLATGTVNGLRWSYRSAGCWTLRVWPQQGDEPAWFWSGMDNYNGNVPRKVVERLVCSLLGGDPALWPDAVGMYDAEITVEHPWKG